MRRQISLLLAGLLSFSWPALADTQSAAERALTAGTVADRDAALAELEAIAGEPLADYAAGSVRFFLALETLGQGLHRYGFESPTSMMIPLMRLPVPPNRTPEKLDYATFRSILVDFRDELEASMTELLALRNDTVAILDGMGQDGAGQDGAGQNGAGTAKRG